MNTLFKTFGFHLYLLEDSARNISIGLSNPRGMKAVWSYQRYKMLNQIWKAPKV